MEKFKEYIENMIIEAYNKVEKGKEKIEKIKEWRERNTFEKNGKKYVPSCRINRI